MPRRSKKHSKTPKAYAERLASESREKHVSFGVSLLVKRRLTLYCQALGVSESKFLGDLFYNELKHRLLGLTVAGKPRVTDDFGLDIDLLPGGAPDWGLMGRWLGHDAVEDPGGLRDQYRRLRPDGEAQ